MFDQPGPLMSLSEAIERHARYQPPKTIKITHIDSEQPVFVSTGHTQISEFATATGFADNSRTKDWPKYDANPRHCSGHGQAECLRQGRHSWWNHAQDGYYA